jgi:regulatory protein
MPGGEGADCTPADIRRAAMNLLARREYARAELGERLERRGMPREQVAAVLDDLVDENLLSDARFAESFVAARSNRGQGPLRIRRELEQRGVVGKLIDAALDEAGVDWRRLAADVRRKRFGPGVPGAYQEKARQMRFLQYRGFDTDQIHQAVAADE